MRMSGRVALGAAVSPRNFFLPWPFPKLPRRSTASLLDFCSSHRRAAGPQQNNASAFGSFSHTRARFSGGRRTPLGMNAHHHSPTGAGSSSSAHHEWRIDIPGDVAPEIDRLLEARQAQLGSLRCRVRRLRDKGVLELYIEEGNVFQLAACKKGKDWLISEMQQGGAYRKHIARVRTHKDRSFTCVREKYEGHSSPPELLVVTHATEQLSNDLPELNTMQLALPRSPQAQLDAPHGSLRGKMERVVQQRTRADADLAILQSRKPKWNARTETYELPFGGRANWASARNFQLVDRDGAADRAVLLYGKMEVRIAARAPAPIPCLRRRRWRRRWRRQWRQRWRRRARVCTLAAGRHAETRGGPRGRQGGLPRLRRLCVPSHPWLCPMCTPLPLHLPLPHPSIATGGRVCARLCLSTLHAARVGDRADYMGLVIHSSGVEQKKTPCVCAGEVAATGSYDGHVPALLVRGVSCVSKRPAVRLA